MAAFTGHNWTVRRTLPREGEFYLVRQKNGATLFRRADRDFKKNTRRVFIAPQPA